MVATLKMERWSNELQRRPRGRFADPMLRSIQECDGDSVAYFRMAGAVTALDVCSSSSSCVASQALDLLLALIDLHARGWVTWSGREGYVDTRGSGHVHGIAAARVLDGDDSIQDRMFTAYADRPMMVAAWLDALPAAAQTNVRQRRLRDLWPGVMGRVLPILKSTANSRHDYERRDLMEALIPIPPSGVEALVWPEAIHIAGGVEELIGWRRARVALVNQLIRYLDARPLADRVTIGFDWLYAIVMEDAQHFANRTRLGDWLRRLRDDQAGRFEPSAKRKWQRLVDALAGAGDSGAIRVQRQEE